MAPTSFAPHCFAPHCFAPQGGDTIVFFCMRAARPRSCFHQIGRKSVVGTARCGRTPSTGTLKVKPERAAANDVCDPCAARGCTQCTPSLLLALFALV